jgi:hypothetical protein
MKTFSVNCPECSKAITAPTETTRRRRLAFHRRFEHKLRGKGLGTPGGATFPASEPGAPTARRSAKGFGRPSICYCPVCGTDLQALAVAYAVARKASR